MKYRIICVSNSLKRFCLLLFGRSIKTFERCSSMDFCFFGDVAFSMRNTSIYLCSFVFDGSLFFFVQHFHHCLFDSRIRFLLYFTFFGVCLACSGIEHSQKAKSAVGRNHHVLCVCFMVRCGHRFSLRVICTHSHWLLVIRSTANLAFHLWAACWTGISMQERKVTHFSDFIMSEKMFRSLLFVGNACI